MKVVHNLGLIGAACLMLTAGCDMTELATSAESAPDPRVTGQVLLDGEPVTSANVVFVPINFQAQDGHRQHLSYGVTDENGRFELAAANGNPGGAVGWNRVIISKLQTTGTETDIEGIIEGEPLRGESPTEAVARMLGFEGQPADEYVPILYNKRSILTFEIPAGEETVEASFNLTTVDPILLEKD